MACNYASDPQKLIHEIHVENLTVSRHHHTFNNIINTCVCIAQRDDVSTSKLLGGFLEVSATHFYLCTVPTGKILCGK